MKEPPPPVPLFARPITKIYFRLFREERAKPANPFSILHPSCSCVSRRHVHPRPSLSLLRFSPDSSDACIIEHSFSLFRSASVQPKFSLAITANRILFAIIAGDAASSLSSSTTAEFPWKSSLETELHGVSYLFDEVDILLGSEGEQEGPPPSSCVHTPAKFERKFGRVFPGNWIREGTILSREGGGSLVRDENT